MVRVLTASRLTPPLCFAQCFACLLLKPQWRSASHHRHKSACDSRPVVRGPSPCPQTFCDTVPFCPRVFPAASRLEMPSLTRLGFSPAAPPPAPPAPCVFADLPSLKRGCKFLIRELGGFQNKDTVRTVIMYLASFPKVFISY